MSKLSERCPKEGVPPRAAMPKGVAAPCDAETVRRAGLFVDSMDELRADVIRHDMERPRPRWVQ